MFAHQPAGLTAWPPLFRNGLQSRRDVASVHLKNNVFAIKWRRFYQHYLRDFTGFSPLISNQISNTLCLLLQSVARSTKTSVARKTLAHQATDVIVPSCFGSSYHRAAPGFTSWIFPHTLTESDFPPLCLWLPWNVKITCLSSDFYGVTGLIEAWEQLVNVRGRRRLGWSARLLCALLL